MSVEPLYHEVLIAGFGGQGIVSAGNLLASAALAEGREVVWAPSYGPEMRGGPVHCTVIVSSERIGSPEVSLADSLLLMDAASMQRFGERIKPTGLMVLNSTLVSARPQTDSLEVLEVPATETAEALGDPRVANVIMLGAFLEARPVVSPESVFEAVQVFAGKAQAGLVDVNREALGRGAALAREVAVRGSFVRGSSVRGS
jgi:2-oxoglutarate ferredoxin oxidoreductase subunit gamma